MGGWGEFGGKDEMTEKAFCKLENLEQVVRACNYLRFLAVLGHFRPSPCFSQEGLLEGV
jgi:hypothetical protein